MTSNAFAIYVLLFGVYLVLFIGTRLTHHAKEILSGIHFALLSLFALQGLACLTFGLMGIDLTLEAINLALLIPILFMAFWCYQDRHGIKTAVNGIHADRRIFFIYLMSVLLAMAAGLLFFTTDLVPSSMTGDPARHFMHIINLVEINPAQTHKPIYYLWAGIFIHALPALHDDQLFVLFNIFVLGLSTSSCLLVFSKLFPTARWLAIFAVVMLVNFGYSLFALHFGYYTLLLSSVYLFSTMALLLEYKDARDERIYLAITLLVIGVVLTHSYLAPDALFILFGFDIWNTRRQRKKTLPEMAKHLPFWILIILVTYASNLGLADGESIERTIAARGFVNNDIWLNLLPFLPFAAWYFVRHWRTESAQLILLFTLTTALFSLIMGALLWTGHAAPYYLNRNQIILLPLLVFAVIALIHKMEAHRATLSRWLYIAIAISVATPYLLLRNPPLATANISLRDLLDDEHWVYLQNAITTSFSPLQMSNRDRMLMRQIGTGKSQCLAGIKDKIAVLGTDHETIWFYIYTHIYPSLFPRNDGFIGFNNYLLNYREWQSSPPDSHIVVVSHFGFWNRKRMLADIRSHATLVCKGDSIEIYRKSAR